MASDVPDLPTRLAHLRGLALAAFAFFVVGCAAAWALRWPLAIWVVEHAGVLRVAEATSPEHLAQATVLLALCAGAMLALPLLIWLGGSLVAPVAFRRARQRFGTYFGMSCLLALTPLLLLRWNAERFRALQAIDPGFFTPMPCDDLILHFARCGLLLAQGVALVVPAFVLARYHSARQGFGRLGFLAALVGSAALLLFGCELLRVTRQLGLLVIAMVVISTGAGLIKRRLASPPSAPIA